MKFDQYGLITMDSGDGGDSAHFTGLYTITGQETNISLCMTPAGPVRHPHQFPWNNPLNFSRDQMMPFVAGLHAMGHIDICQDVLALTKQRNFFAPNIERDAPGTRKYPWPHYAHRQAGVSKWVWFDFADPLLPHHIAALYVASLEPRPVGIDQAARVSLILELVSIKLSKNDDIGAILATCFILNEVKLFKTIVNDWQKRLDSYCLGWRNLDLLHKELSLWLSTAD